MTTEQGRRQATGLPHRPGSSHAEWQQGLAALRHYVAVRGSALVPCGARADGIAVGRWAEARRKEYWAGQLDLHKAALLESLPGWEWSGPHQRLWHTRLAALRRHAAKHLSADVGPDMMIGTLRIGAWVAAQRSAYAAGTLPSPNASLLADLPGWRWARDEDLWEVQWNAAQEHVAAHGTIALGEHMNGTELAEWIARCHYDHRVGKLAPDQVAVLESLPGWRWTGPRHRWEKGYAALLTYVERTGTACPPQNTVIHEMQLGQWVREARRQYRVGTLPRSRQQALERLPGWQWSVYDAAWERGLDMLRCFLEMNGRPPRESETMDDFAVGVWVRTQRSQYRRGRMKSERTERLEATFGWSWTSS